MSEPLFRETQHVRQWWIWLMVGGVDFLFLYSFVQQVILHIPFGDNPAPDEFFLVIFLIVAGVTLLIASMKLEIEISADGIAYRFPPFIRKRKLVAFSELHEAQVRSYRPIAEYGGWGYRIGLGGKGQALNVSGNQGLQLVFMSGKRLLLGTQQPEELQQALNMVFHHKSAPTSDTTDDTAPRS